MDVSNRLISMQEAAEILHITCERLHWLINTGQLPVFERTFEPVVKLRDVEELALTYQRIHSRRHLNE